jgi:hypothetical protein
VLARFVKTFAAFLLIAIMGGHMAFLQTVAWTAMLADNLQSSSLPMALERTFDGKHPCPLCMAIAAAKKSQKKNDVTPQMRKLEFPPASENFVLIAPGSFEILKVADTFADAINLQPPVPPPRELPA